MALNGHQNQWDAQGRRVQSLQGCLWEVVRKMQCTSKMRLHFEILRATEVRWFSLFIVCTFGFWGLELLKWQSWIAWHSRSFTCSRNRSQLSTKFWQLDEALCSRALQLIDVKASRPHQDDLSQTIGSKCGMMFLFYTNVWKYHQRQTTGSFDATKGQKDPISQFQLVGSPVAWQTN